MLGQASMNYKELLTIIFENEDVINYRPLTCVSNDSKNVAPLTPSMNLRDLKASVVADLDFIDSNKRLIR